MVSTLRGDGHRTASVSGPVGDGSAAQAHQVLSRLRMVPVQAVVLVTALALAPSVLAGQVGHPAVQESARAVNARRQQLSALSPGPCGPGDR